MEMFLMYKYTVALAKGELGQPIEEYMKSLGYNVQVTGKPRYVQRRRDIIFRIMRAKDVAELVGSRYDFGITGKDCVVEENSKANVLEELRFGIGRVVVYGKRKSDLVFCSNPTFVTSYYPNISRRFIKGMWFGSYELYIADGSEEGFVAANEASIGIGCTFSGETLCKNGLVVIKELMATCGVLIARDGLSIDDFYDIMLRR